MPCVASVTPFGVQRPAERPAIDGSRVRIIVEFTSLPRARTAGPLRSTAQSGPPFERFRDDLKEIQASRTESAADIRQEYSRAFSGVALSVTPSQRAAIEKLP